MSDNELFGILPGKHDVLPWQKKLDAMRPKERPQPRPDKPDMYVLYDNAGEFQNVYNRAADALQGIKESPPGWTIRGGEEELAEKITIDRDTQTNHLRSSYQIASAKISANFQHDLASEGVDDSALSGLERAPWEIALQDLAAVATPVGELDGGYKMLLQERLSALSTADASQSNAPNVDIS